MAVTTLTEFSAGVANVAIVGRVTKLLYPPDKIEDAELPLSFPQTPQGDEMPITFDGGGGWPALSIELVYAHRALGGGTPKEKYDGALAAADALREGLSALEVSKSELSWTITTDVVIEVGGRRFTGAVALVTGKG